MKYRQTTQTEATRHTPIRRERDGADTAVVFIHGFIGSPGQFSDLMDIIYGKGCSCFSLLLPGHGAQMRDFARFDDDDWERHVQEEINKIRDKYSRIILVGHSMGGLLALNISLHKDNRISGIMLLSTPLKVYLLNPKSLGRKLRLLTFPGNNEIKAAYIKAGGIVKSHILSYPLIIKPLSSLFRLIRRTKKQLSRVTVPVYIIHSENDETTSHKSAKLLQDGLCSAQTAAFPLRKSWHAYYQSEERKIILDKLLELIQIAR